MICSLGSATSTRVANSLGAGNAEGARLVFRVSALLTLCIGGAAACLTYLLRRPLVSLFTEEPAVVALAARALPFMALSLLGDSCVAVLGNVLRAAGRQGYGATLNILGYWCLGLPLSMFLGFRLDLGIIGFWIGLSTAAAFQAVVFATVISRFDWRHEVQRSEDLLAANLAAGGGGNAEATPLLPDDGGSGSGSSGDDGGAAKASGGGLVISPDDEETGAGAAAAAGVQSTLDGDLRSPFLPQ
ncbi:putative transporter [Monoraphidium neglectum]|uniref:Putative transporter n=1 Tax=Monoraphidium neglectum TaxID=145388 RepID=A0A0D2KAZ6_9CHLO|nr:putative transporter [Monoraphidium neglectum]KIZ07408.1 putative transporter [Monoraphidium neglectum]|eukprot:XP_013906427.1 putative transporter [Monoraphidium neglectum]